MSEEKKAIEMLRNYDNEDNLHKIHQSINVLLNLIEKQQKEIQNLQTINKEHQKLNGELRKEIEKWKMLATQKLIKNKENCIKIQSQCISKDKIREKIKDLEDNMILFTNDKEKFNRYKYARDILEKLLEEK